MMVPFLRNNQKQGVRLKMNHHIHETRRGEKREQTILKTIGFAEESLCSHELADADTETAEGYLKENLYFLLYFYQKQRKLLSLQCKLSNSCSEKLITFFCVQVILMSLNKNFKCSTRRLVYYPRIHG